MLIINDQLVSKFGLRLEDEASAPTRMSAHQAAAAVAALHAKKRASNVKVGLCKVA